MRPANRRQCVQEYATGGVLPGLPREPEGFELKGRLGGAATRGFHSSAQRLPRLVPGATTQGSHRAPRPVSPAFFCRLVVVD